MVIPRYLDVTYLMHYGYTAAHVRQPTWGQVNVPIYTNFSISLWSRLKAIGDKRQRRFLSSFVMLTDDLVLMHGFGML